MLVSSESEEGEFILIESQWNLNTFEPILVTFFVNINRITVEFK